MTDDSTDSSAAGDRPGPSPGAGPGNAPSGATREDRTRPGAEHDGTGGDGLRGAHRAAGGTGGTGAPENAEDSGSAGNARNARSTASAADPHGTDGVGRDGADRPRPKPRRGRDRDKVLAGVCNGAGRYFDIDPVVFRVVLAVLALTDGIGLIVYGMGWLIVPQEGEEQSEAQRLLSGRIEGPSLTAVLMALVGCGVYASTLGNAGNQAFSLILLAAAAAAVFWSSQRGRPRTAGEARFTAASTVADVPPAAQAPPEPGSTPSWWRDPLSKSPGYLWGPQDGAAGTEDARVGRERGKSPRGERRWLFGLMATVLTVTALAIGVGASWHHQPAGVSAEIGLAAALGVLGVGFVVASFAGRAQGGTVFWSVLTVAALVVVAAMPKAGGHGVGTTTWRPLTASAVPPLYERSAGTAELDLTRLRLGGAEVRTTLKLGAGKAVVRLPRNAVVRLDYHVWAGRIDLPGQSHRGVRVESAHGRRVTYRPASGVPATGTLDVDVEVVTGLGRVVR